MEHEAYVKETREHIYAVRELVQDAAMNLQVRSLNHDKSKLVEPEASGFQRIAALAECKDIEYGSREYKDRLAQEKPTIDHHYAHNDHHPEYWRTHKPAMHMWGITDDTLASGELVSSMSLMAIIEMICDWKAASNRYKDGSFVRSFDTNMERFGISSQLKAIIWNTAVELGIVTADGQDV